MAMKTRLPMGIESFKEMRIQKYYYIDKMGLIRDPLGDVLFTGLNNFKVYTVKDVRYNEYFGFTDMEVRQMLEYYGFTEQYGAVNKLPALVQRTQWVVSDFPPKGY